jgi:hypothetical protein
LIVGLCLAIGLLTRSAAAQYTPVAGDPPTSFLKSELPKWLYLGAEDRLRMETLDGVGFKNHAINTYVLERLRLNMRIKPTKWLSFSFKAEDSRSFFTDVHPVPASQREPLNLVNGYVQLGDAETGMFSLRAGRQSMSFGEGRVVADPPWSNITRSFDEVRGTFHYKIVRVDAFSGISDKASGSGLSLPVAGEHFDGVYGHVDRVIPKAVVEPYFLWKMEHNVKGEKIKHGNLDEQTTGFRIAGQMPLGFDYGTEMALQRGFYATEPVRSWFGHWGVGFTLPDAKHLPRFFAELNRGSGDHNPKDGIHGDFDPLFQITHDKYGVSDLFALTNLTHTREGFQYKMSSTLSLSTGYNSFWLSDMKDGIYSSGKLIVASTGTQGNYIGSEPDVEAKWRLSRNSLVEVDAGHLFAGEFLTKTGHVGYNCVFLGFMQTF